MCFYIEKKKGILGASPDGLVTDPIRNNPYGLIEAKNVLVQDGETLKDALVRKSVRKMSETGFKVKKNHMYFYQIQQQLLVVNRDWGVLAILGSKGKFFNEEIAFEPEWWEEKLNNIEKIYEKFIHVNMSWLNPESKMALLDVIFTKASLHNVLQYFLKVCPACAKLKCRLLLMFFLEMLTEFNNC